MPGNTNQDCSSIRLNTHGSFQTNNAWQSRSLEGRQQVKMIDDQKGSLSTAMTMWPWAKFQAPLSGLK